METTPTATVTPISVGIRYGLLVGIISVILDLLLKTTGLDFKQPFLGLSVAIAIWVVGMVLAHKYFKQHNGGFMTYGQGLLIGLLMGAISGLLSGIFNYVYINFLDTSYVNSVRDYTEATLANLNLPEEAMEKGLADITQEKLGSPLAILKNIVVGAVMSFLLSLIVSAITKHNRPQFE
ncbi:DUF4199 domain-containing protein [Hymenobacter guriensis]|uniref:DUF4199 domain-containing protein n=1 Tax=Hymenobacter guriensis TaxID=2793065 RepID=A0ABS0L6E0_9BACT|nr:DUF4199 domain-containing protein [Hymenobacter guriensis]MBG8555715.1 DUF4199 domain-containing protein [Hymenobacter guriensis]